MSIKSDKELAHLEAIGRIARNALGRMTARAGSSFYEIDRAA
jgi:hypothetical protein